MPEQEVQDEDVLPGLFFSRSPRFSHVHFENNVAQARDGLASERNFLSSMRTAVYMMLAATSVIGVGSQTSQHGWADWTLSALLLAVGVLIPVVSLLNYAHAFDSWLREVAAVHTIRMYTATVLFAAVVAILTMVRQFVVS